MKSYDMQFGVTAKHVAADGSYILLRHEEFGRITEIKLALEREDAEAAALDAAFYLVSYDRRLPKIGDCRKAETTSDCEYFDGKKWVPWNKFRIPIKTSAPKRANSKK